MKIQQDEPPLIIALAQCHRCRAMEPPQKKLCSSLRGTATAAVHGDALAVEEGDVPDWAFSLAQERMSPAPKQSPWLNT
jgi:hypothetical protein